MKIDITKIRVGDRITVEAEVIDTDTLDQEFPVKAVELGWVLYEQIVGHTPKVVERGDSVFYRSPTTQTVEGLPYKVVATHGQYAWLRVNENDPGRLVHLGNVERV